MNNLSICKFCGENKKLIKAHIIPKAFFEDNKLDESHLLILGNKYIEKSYTGIYDHEILCSDCEELYFSPLDDYGRKLIKKIQDTPPITLHGAKGSIRTKKIDDHIYMQTKLFFVSILWRASVSDRREYKHVNLGLLEEKARQLIISNSDQASLFQVALLYFKTSTKVVKGELTVMMPIKGKFDNRHSYTMHFGGIKIHICAEKRGWQHQGSIDQICLKEQQSIILPEFDLDSSKAMVSFVRLAKSYEDTKP